MSEKKLFIDELRVGPYKEWNHQHHFKPIEGGVEMTEILFNNVIPLGIMAGVLEQIIVRGKLKEIFNYRQ